MTVAPERTATAQPAERGRLEISDSVLRKIVEHATDQVPGTVRATRRVAGLDLGESGSSAKVSVGDELMDVRLDLALRYPESIASVVARVRERVGEEVTRITGLQVRTFDVTVSGLHHEQTTRLH
ncbi:MAG: Asp23/Gls24 family envelope stress response protein [Pseudonocardia sp.]